MIQWYILSLISAFFSATAAITQKKVLFKESALGFSAALAIFNLILAIPFFLFTDFSLLTSTGLLVLLFKSFLGALAFLCVMLGIKNLEISRALPLLILTPGLVALFAFIFLGEALTSLEILGMLLLVGGTYTLALKKDQKIKGPLDKAFDPRGHYYIILALVLFATTSVLDKAVLKNFHVPLNAFMGFQHLFFAGIFLLILIFSNKTKSVKSSLARSWKLILLISFFTITYRYAHLQAIKIAPVALALSIKRISVFFAVVIGGTLFKEHNLMRKTIATAMMVAGAILIIMF
ncbi:EamA family transporter [Candidatus Pacearchaeota archaeon]|nr:EamA family transporter [Candidatus Pacearchaeota archaeon]